MPNNDAEKLRAVVERSGLSARAFAYDVLTRDERTVRRWLNGYAPIPQAVAAKLDAWLVKPPKPL